MIHNWIRGFVDSWFHSFIRVDLKPLFDRVFEVQSAKLGGVEHPQATLKANWEELVRGAKDAADHRQQVLHDNQEVLGDQGAHVQKVIFLIF